ncbi:alpha/beta hydrolase [Granulicella arctica]|uniref:Acetyl esterase/lipase n=1 Tax=Granulicella arctica TaxID=940613 RepID=A0A7Y9PH92_9BACT|nr:alpha/beta hydrolase [Granulicella arctica]NYF79695.1 acetyl esterase/lipase [Granulicella arctica]
MMILRAVSLGVLGLGVAASAQQVKLPLWSHGAPGSLTITGTEHDATTEKDALVAGRKLMHLTDVSEPSLAVYKAGVDRPAVVVFPGGGYRILAYDLEGTEVCAWLNSIHVACVLVKYRVPVDGHFPAHVEDLEDAQQAMRLTRLHAKEWGIDAKRVGALGFSAGAHLVAVLSNHFDFAGPGVEEHGGVGSGVSARPDFAFVLYPGYLANPPDLMKLAAEAQPSVATPPTFLLQAEDDPVHEENVLVYFQALKEAKVPAELHVFAKGGHGYGLRATELPVTHWPVLAEEWLKTIGVLRREGFGGKTGNGKDNRRSFDCASRDGAARGFAQDENCIITN